MSSLHAVLFDLDGVLVDSYEVWFRLINAAAVRFDAARIDAEGFRAIWGQGVDADAVYLDCPIDKLESFYNAHFMDFGSALGIDPAGATILGLLRAAGLQSAIITNTPAELARQILQVARLEPDALVGGTDVASPKPAPDMVLRACALLTVEPSQAVVVGDSRFDREAAAAASTRFIGLRTDGERRIEQLEALPDLLGLAR